MPNDAVFRTDLAAAQSGDADAEQRLTQANLPLVHAIARRYRERGVDYDDLVQLGSIGLLKAIRRFDAAYGVCFSTYAVPLIAGEIKRFLRDDGMVRFSRSVKELALAVQRAAQAHPELTVCELADRLGVTEADLAAAAASSALLRSLDEPDPLTGEPFGASIADQNTDDPHDRLLIEELLSSLDERERTLILLRYKSECTQAEVGKRLGISQVQVSRLEKRILLKLRSQTVPVP